MSCSSAFAQTDDKSLILKIFQDYKTAIQEYRPKDAFRLLDAKTLLHYRALLNDIQEADFKRADTLPLYDKFYLLMFRHNTPKATLLQMTVSQMTEIVLQQEIINKLETIDNVEVNGNTATAMRVGNGKPSGYLHHFTKEKSGWKFSHRGGMEVFNEVWGNLAREGKKSDNDFLIERVENITHKKVSPNIWKPLRSKK
ncbi:MAG TPA: hypothetical protein PK858_04800 [Saprospiraceae bacterium]|nr:hypothetical protein [Saprospiraceae bacterium]